MLTYNVMSQKAINYIANGVKGALFLLPVLTLLVSDHLFFPFITTKNFFFRFSVEILFFFWVLLMVFDKKYRPRKSPVLLALAGTLFILFLATFFGENIYRSFWSNYERMEGLIGHIHLFAYFLILTSLLRTKKSWKIFFGSMVLVSLIVSVYAFLQFSGGAEIHQSATRLDATLGNATYLAVFIIFHLFLISLLALWFKNKWLRISLAILFALETIVMFFTATRGAILGFLGGLFVMGVLISILGKNKKLRYAFMGLVVGCLVIVSLFVLFKDTNFVKQNYVLSRFAGISFSEQTVESRFTIWKMSFEGFQEHPVLGWGPENYNLVFNKYYVPKLWRQEPWFDRSHNVLFDWLITAGILGLLSYLFIYASSLYVVWKGYKKKTMGILEASAVTALFGAYLFHNLFVFDNLTSYFAFFSVLGYLHFCWVSNKEEKEEKESIRRDLPFSSYILITFVFIATVISLVFVNVKPLLANTKIIETLFFIRASQPPQQALEKFDEVFGYNSFGSGEAREQLIGYANKLVSVQGVSEEVKIQVIN
ncbi:MAG: O-antigen ligase family protein, partial [Candidatus Marinimicrobia bacterium]|nr:O-antigen ligase family protein [Candidatus Neomarinimicrobiota bacterium]